MTRPWAAARPRAARAASFARRVASKPGQAPPPPTGAAAWPLRRRASKLARALRSLRRPTHQWGLVCCWLARCACASRAATCERSSSMVVSLPLISAVSSSSCLWSALARRSHVRAWAFQSSAASACCSSCEASAAATRSVSWTAVSVVGVSAGACAPSVVSCSVVFSMSVSFHCGERGSRCLCGSGHNKTPHRVRYGGDW